MVQITVVIRKSIKTHVKIAEEYNYRHSCILVSELPIFYQIDYFLWGGRESQHSTYLSLHYKKEECRVFNM